jgi:formylglycine-generating enzyme required for sulfatase activity/TolB-like protein
MKKTLIVILTLFVCASLFAQQPVVAITPFTAISGISAADANAITRVFFIRLGNTRQVILRGSDLVEQVLREHNFQTGDWSNQQKTAEIGRALNADWIVRGELEKFGTSILVTVQFYDIQTFRFMGGSDLRLVNADEAYDKMDPLVDKLIQTIKGIDGGNNPDRGQPPAPANMVRVEGGTFQMGTASGGDSDERPVHTVTVKSFYMGKYEVTQREWREIMGTTLRQQRDMANRSWSLYGEGDNYPMYYVSWYEAVEYCNKLSIKEGLTPAYRGSGDNITCDWNASGYRLPTEAEWEYAAKGGIKDLLTATYSGSNSVDAVAWYDGNSRNSTHTVGTKAHNSLGLYDMSGNVWEWCWDWFGNYSSGTQDNPRGAVSGADRVLRGGSWSNSAANVRSASRYSYTPSYRSISIGFRLVRP